MNDLQSSYLWFKRLLFCALALCCLLFHLLPLQILSPSAPMPDLLMCFAFCWSLRRPEYVPLSFLALIFLLADLLLQRPPGLWAALLLIGCEYLKSLSKPMQSENFFQEWLRITALSFGVLLVYRLTFTLFLIDQPSFGLQLMQMLLTVLFYPIAVFLSFVMFRVQKTPLGDLDTTRLHR